jgi:hypothetical protein
MLNNGANGHRESEEHEDIGESAKGLAGPIGTPNAVSGLSGQYSSGMNPAGLTKGLKDVKIKDGK